MIKLLLFLLLDSQYKSCIVLSLGFLYISFIIIVSNTIYNTVSNY